MFALLPRQGCHRRTAERKAGAHLRRLAAVLAAVVCGLLASAAVVPAASAMIRVPGPGGAYGGNPAAPIVRVVTSGGMAGWQIALIAAGAAVLGAAAAVLVDRVVAARRAASVLTL